MKYVSFAKHEHKAHVLFELGILLKGLNGIWESAGGCLLLLTNKIILINLFYRLAAEELLEDPKDATINFLGQSVQNLSIDTKTFIALYMLAHGIINIFLAVQLRRGKIWAYAFSLSVMSAFFAYQAYRIFIHHSAMLILVTMFDLVFILLTWHEYRRATAVRRGELAFH